MLVYTGGQGQKAAYTDNWSLPVGQAGNITDTYPNIVALTDLWTETSLVLITHRAVTCVRLFDALVTYAHLFAAIVDIDAGVDALASEILDTIFRFLRLEPKNQYSNHGRQQVLEAFILGQARMHVLGDYFAVKHWAKLLCLQRWSRA